MALPTDENTRELDELIAEVEEQEARLVLPAPLEQADAWALLQVAASVIEEQADETPGFRLAVDVRLGTHLVARVKLNESEPGTDWWLAAKSRTVLALGESSLLVRYRHLKAGTAFADRALDPEAYAGEGGSFPLKVRAADGSLTVIGTITMSGQEGYVDHAFAVRALERYLAG